jgi:hypothetical protein
MLMDAIFEFLHGILPPNAGEAFGTFVSAALTVMIFSYIAGDNLFFRLAQHILIGCVAAYAVVVAVHSVLLAILLAPLAANPSGEWPLLVPLVLGVLLLFKASPQTSRFGSTSIAFMLGVGAALGIGGALLGTLLPQLRATMISFFNQLQVSMSPAEQFGLVFSNLIIVLGTLGAFLSFHFSAGRPDAGARWFSSKTTAAPLVLILLRARQTLLLTWGGFGRVLIWIAFGALFAGVALSRITLLVERVQFLLDAFHLAVR